MDEPSPLESARAVFGTAIERYRELHKQTENPVYFWVALWACGALRQAEAGFVATEAPLVLPAWCADYFTSVAFDIQGLADGADVAREGKPGRDYTRLNSEAAMRLLPRALGFTRPGFSAFDKMQATRGLMDFFHRYEELKASGATSAVAIERLMSEFGLEEERTARRKIASGRRYVKGERPEERRKVGET